MKTNYNTNCSLVRVPIVAGVSDYYLPQNVDWASEKVDRIVICAPQNACTDPLDGVTPVVTSPIQNCFFSLYNAENSEIYHDVSVEQLLYTNNNGLDVDAVLNISLCRFYFTQAPTEDSTLLVYVFYKTRVEEYAELPSRSITVTFPLAANELKSFRDIINYYMHAIPQRVKGIICWNAEEYPAWITLRDFDLTYQMANIHSAMMRSPMNAGEQYYTFMLNDLDIDFDYSNIREAAGIESIQKITFLY